MFRKKHHGPSSQPFSHSDDCKIVKADPGVEIPWSEVEGGHWRAVCVCGSQDYYVPAGRPARLDPLDPSTAMHAGECEFKDVTDRAVLRVVLKVRDGADQSYKWVSCGGCDYSWPVSVYESVK